MRLSMKLPERNTIDAVMDANYYLLASQPSN